MNNTVTIRLATPQDAVNILKIYAPYVENTAISFEYEVPSEAEFRGRIESTLKRYPYIVAEQEGRIIGYAYVSIFHERKAYDWAVETSIGVDKDCKSSGCGKLLYQVLEKILKKQHISNLYACIAFPIGEDPYLTEDSVHFHEHLGYQRTAHFHKCGYKFHRWYDIVWMEKMIGEHLENQPAIRPFPELGK